MNIFILDENPEKAARDHCDKHVIKMILESGQMLCSAHEQGKAPWKRSHYNHPCTIWARTTKENYRWLATLGLELCAEYTRRYNKHHKSENVLIWCAENIPTTIPDGPLTQFAIAIKNSAYHRPTAVESYRAYYIGDKVRFARWKYCEPPQWWISVFGEQQKDCP